MNTETDSLIEEYGEWLKHESSIRNTGEWNEITLPYLDRSNDELCFYAKTEGDSISLTDDGYTFAMFQQGGMTLTEARKARMERIACKFGAKLEADGQITLFAEDGRADAMNRYVQALSNIGAIMETTQRKVAEYFAEDVAAELDRHNVFYTPDVQIRGISSYDNNFDFLFQRSANHPTRFCQAPNRLDKDTVRQIMFGWNDTKQAPQRRESKLIVIGDDRETPLQEGAVHAFMNYGVTVIRYSELGERAPIELAA
ncbi:DUF1829 domain-containing protein [Bifidobacterium scaligerum]|uniref:DUF1829 domain-containing protein n=1 Tax=Bifidobacterium scaligerum TaxID=2052656 RepID=A0A2M9HT36_9BIFI|nr:DUF1829 domain-containing protein [Bifidobacterium scaligerum]PJM79970.1 hypothetical protein CUU80_02215 [Bifidobacterium scaligerum]